MLNDGKTKTTIDRDTLTITFQRKFGAPRERYVSSPKTARRT